MGKLKNLSDMSQSERQRYMRRVTAWYEHEGVDEGLLLLTALPQAATFLSYAGCYHNEQKIKEIRRLLTRVVPDTTPQAATAAIRHERVGKVGPVRTTPQQDTKQPSAGCYTTSAGSRFYLDAEGKVTSVAGPRPTHFDEWSNLMPEGLRKKVDTIQENFANMVYWRREVERLAADPNHSKADMSHAAKLTCNYEALNLNIFAQAEACWEELCGKTVSEESKNKILEEEKRLRAPLQTSPTMGRLSKKKASSPGQEQMILLPPGGGGRGLSYSRLRDIVEKEDSTGAHVPFSITYACLNGGLVDIPTRDVICIGVDPRHRRRNIKVCTSGQIRTVHDCLILRVNDSQIIVK